MKSRVFVDRDIDTPKLLADMVSSLNEKDREVFVKHLSIQGSLYGILNHMDDLRKFRLEIGNEVEVVIPFFWYSDEYKVGDKFIIGTQHIGHNFERYVKLV